MEEILHHLGCIKASKWDIYHINWLAGFLPSTVPPPKKRSPYTLIDQDLFRLINMINKSTNRITPWTHQAADDLSCQKKWHPLLWQCAAHIAWHMGGFWRSGNLKPGRVIWILISKDKPLSCRVGIELTEVGRGSFLKTAPIKLSFTTLWAFILHCFFSTKLLCTNKAVHSMELQSRSSGTYLYINSQWTLFGNVEDHTE